MVDRYHPDLVDLAAKHVGFSREGFFSGEEGNPSDVFMDDLEDKESGGFSRKSFCHSGIFFKMLNPATCFHVLSEYLNGCHAMKFQFDLN